jgi:hypothetical protein
VNRCGKLAAEEIQTNIEVAHARLSYRTSRLRAAEPHKRSRWRERHHYPRENLIVLSSLPSVRKVFCDERTCQWTIFAKRLSGVVRYYARTAERLDGWFTHVSFALGGKAGYPLLQDLGIVVSGDTLLNHIRSTQLQDHETPKVLSVDDFAFRRGFRDGTVLVDLERRELVDVLPDRSADTFARWLAEHPGVEVVRRDRGGGYAEATRRAALGAVQIANRFHLLNAQSGDLLENG